MKTNEKKFYIPPTLEVTRVMLEHNVAIQSPVKNVELKDWSYEGPENDVNNNADVWLNI